MFMVRGALVVALVALLGLAAGNNDLDQALVCSAGRSCQFSADVNLRTQDRAESANEKESDGFKDIEMTLDFDVIASCSSSANEHGYQYFRVVVTEVMGGMPGKEAEFKKLPFFFVQDEETGKIISIYTSSKDKKAAAVIKHALVSSLAKKFNKNAVQKAQEAMTEIQGKAEPINYVFEGEDETGPFEAHHEIHPESDGGFTLIESMNYKSSGSSSISKNALKEKVNGQSIKVSAKKVAKSKVDGKGRIIKIKEAAEAKVGSGKAPKKAAVQSTPDIGEAKFKLEFDVIRVGKEDVATCSQEFETSSLQEFESAINAELDGAVERQVGRAYQFHELDHDELEDVDDSALTAHADQLMALGDVQINDLQAVARPSNIKQIIDNAWDRYEQNQLAHEDMKSVLAVAGQVASPEAYTSLLDLVKDPHSHEDLRTQALLALQPTPGTPHVPSFVLDAVADVAFSDDELANDAALTLGTLCDGHPMGQAHVVRLENELSANNGDAERLINLEDALSNAHGHTVGAGSSDVEQEDLEELETDEEQDDDAVTDLDMGFSGSKSLLNKNWKLAGNKNFQLTSVAKCGAKWDTTAAKVDALGSMDTKILKYKKNLLHISFNAKAQGNTAGASFKFAVVGKTLKSWSKSGTSKWVKYGGACPSHIKTVPKAWGKDWKKTFFTFSARFALGPVPIKVAVSVTGSVGISAHIGGYINCKSKTSGDVQLLGGAHPYGTVGVSASAAVDAFIARAGVSGSVTLLKGGVPVYGIARMKEACGKVDLQLSGLSGSIKIFAEVGLGGKKDEEALEIQNDLEVSPLVSNVEEGEKQLWLRRKLRRAWRGVRNVARRAVSIVKKGARAAWNGVKTLAKKLNKRWEKTILSWKGPSKNVNLFKLCYQLNLGRFFGGKKKDDGKNTTKTTSASDKKTDGKKTDTKAGSCPTGAKKAPAGLKWNQFQSWFAENSVPKTTPSQRSAAYKAYKKNPCVVMPKKPTSTSGNAVIAQSQRTRDTIRETSQRTRETARKEGKEVKKAASQTGTETRSTVRDVGQRGRETAREASRRAETEAKQEAVSERKQQRRSEARAQQASANNQALSRRLTSRLKKSVENMEKSENNRRMRSLLRREGAQERARNARLEKEIRRRANRQRFAKLASITEKNEQKIKKKIRDDRAQRRQKREFRHLRHQEQRRFRKLRRKEYQEKERKFIRRQTATKSTLRHQLSHIKHTMSRQRNDARERRRLSNLDSTVKKENSLKKKTRSWFSKLGKRIRSMSTKLKGKAKKGWGKIVGAFRRARDRRLARRTAAKQRSLVRRNAQRTTRARRSSWMKSLLRKGFSRARKLTRAGARRLKDKMRRLQEARRRRAAARRLRERTRRSARRGRTVTRDASRRTKKTIRRSASKAKKSSWWASLKKKIKKVKKVGKKYARKGRSQLRKLMQRGKKSTRRVFARGRRAARRIGKRVLGTARRSASRLMRRLR